VGEPFDQALLTEVARPGIKALICDSTNVFSSNPGRSEADIVGPLNELIKGATGMVVATTFASNVARLKTLAQAAADQGRSIVVVGRAMDTMIQTAFATGVLENFPPIVPTENARDIPRDNLFVLATGSQGERRAATAQMAGGSFQGMEFKEGDTMLFSSKTIPGNEVGVARILNQLSQIGVRTIEADDRYHVSGHANSPDLELIHRLMNPKNVIPMHGEHRHLVAHAELARKNGFHAVVAPNGAIVDLTGDEAHVIDNVETGRTYLDGSELIGALDGIVRDRIRLAIRGIAVISVMLESDNSLIDGVWVEMLGLPETGRDGDVIATLEKALIEEIEKAGNRELSDDDALERMIRRVCNAEFGEQIGKKPQLVVLINRFD
jgi:ribonuclease J